ncbi:hypothetical protein BDA99DRAFT_512029 [Phascolomyces articulosus]|uniref:F-box domain-containing protein n=1 Tax=Phascolomyces articulosus TaxID=60185 RepID=A0AAD5PDA2_9FUNG|nr:hypothetical protein BDA99DRAFT_512029 [Phascolomyces articulosus]
MHLIKRGIDAFTSATTSTRTLLSQLETKASIASAHDDIEKQLTIAKEMIKVVPTSPKGYLLAGRVYIKQNNLKSALNIYKKGLDQVPSIISSYTTLKRNYDAVHNELTNQQREIQLLQQRRKPTSSSGGVYPSPSFSAYDIICLIFHHLSLIDLIKCTTVCKSWNRLIIKWPPFWKLVDAYLPQLDPESFKIYLSSPKHHGLRFLGKEQQQLEKLPLSIVFSVLAALQEYHHPLESLIIENMMINTNLSHLLNNLQLNTSLKSIELYYISFPSNTLLGPLILACHSAERIVFKSVEQSSKYIASTKNQQNNANDTFAMSGIDEFKRKAANLSFKITHLEISFGGHHLSTTTTIPDESSSSAHVHKNDDMLLNEIIRHCKHLCHLFVDSQDHISHGEIMQTINEACPFIQDVIINNPCRMPNTMVVSNNNNNNNNNTIEKEKTEHNNRGGGGLRRFVMAGSDEYYNTTPEQVLSFLKKHQHTIELLYLHHDGRTITPELLSQLGQEHQQGDRMTANNRTTIATATFPELRELWLYTQEALPTTTHSFSDALSEFLLCCPLLQTFSVVDLSIEPTTPLVTDSVLQSLKHLCNTLQYMRIHGHRSFSAQALQQLTISSTTAMKSNNNSNFEMTLDLNFMHHDLVTVIHQWKSLKNVIIRRTTRTTTADNIINNYKKTSLSKTDLEMYKLLEAILRKRGGTLYDYSKNEKLLS